MRRRRPERRQILPDPVYNDKLVAKFVNYVMEQGKKGVAENIFYGADDLLINSFRELQWSLPIAFDYYIIKRH